MIIVWMPCYGRSKRLEELALMGAGLGWVCVRAGRGWGARPSQGNQEHIEKSDAVLHRISFAGEDTPSFFMIGSWFVILAPAPLAIGIAGILCRNLNGGHIADARRHSCACRTLSSSLSLVYPAGRAEEADGRTIADHQSSRYGSAPIPGAGTRYCKPRGA